ncbi:ribulose-bisphosphate carboxylase large subunit family protein [bacterium]|jgi:ribulose-bisphosphate carboxylase large chain|nr:ribulose 1,5-bisphosphate carboxylase [Gemmatimonadota bacterium]MBE83055.1 ribulose 1,5-bisphosphate carboxylase [Gemmatimonadota bacterium]MCH2665298.1 ribulose-bisphosphate carboxylase large subunit family protein [bacterium]HCK08767.1 ribulose 1,5-bisphosphate carboxylase [Candidatus Latescibacterota bacterium]
MGNRIVATYWMETPFDVERAADVVSGEQSSGTFVQVPGETADLKKRSRARIESIERLEDGDAPSLPGALPSKDGVYRRAEVKISFPIENMGPSLPNLIATVAGNLFELRDVSGLKLIDLELPDDLKAIYPGPQFGIQGTRDLASVHDRPIIGTIVKPSVGLTPEATADLVGDLAGANIDFVKDDELMANGPNSPIEKRVEKVMAVINAAADASGKQVMFAFNITDELDAMLMHHDLVRDAGGTCVMVSLNSIGPVALAHLRRHCELPIHGHRNGWGMYTRSPHLGIGFRAYQKIWRVAGVDHIHVNGLQNKFWEPDDSVVASIQACFEPILGGYPVMPVISSGQWGGQAPETYTRIQSVDVMYLAGGGIMAHPGGPPAGNIALRQCWEAAVKGIPLQDYAKDHTELAQSIEKFGGHG